MKALQGTATQADINGALINLRAELIANTKDTAMRMTNDATYTARIDNIFR